MGVRRFLEIVLEGTKAKPFADRALETPPPPNRRGQPRKRVLQGDQERPLPETGGVRLVSETGKGAAVGDRVGEEWALPSSGSGDSEGWDSEGPCASAEDTDYSRAPHRSF